MSDQAMSGPTGSEGTASSSMGGGVAPENATAPPAQPSDPIAELKGHPAWGELFDKTPEGLHGLLIPTLQKWDKNFQEVQSSYKPWKQIAEAGITPDQAGTALQFMQLANQNPRAIYDQLVQVFGDEWGLNQPQTQQAQNENQGQKEGDGFSFLEEPDIANHPMVQQLQQQQEILAQYLASQVQEQENAQADAELDQEINSLREKYGDFEERFVVPLAIQTGMPLEQAVLAWKNQVDQIRSQPRAGANMPPVMSTNGGTPSNAVDPSSLDSAGTINLVKSWLSNNNG